MHHRLIRRELLALCKPAASTAICPAADSHVGLGPVVVKRPPGRKAADLTGILPAAPAKPLQSAVEDTAHLFAAADGLA